VLPYLARQLSVFNRLPTEGYPQDGKFWVRGRRDQELEGARNTKLRQVLMRTSLPMIHPCLLRSKDQ
jgi:hypothetical protein